MIHRAARRVASALLLAAPLLWIEAVRWLAGAALVPEQMLGRAVFVGAILAAAWAGAPRCVGGRSWRWPWPTALVVVVAALAAVWYGLHQATLAAWLLVGAGDVLLFWTTLVVTADLRRWLRLVLPFGTALLAGFATAMLGQIEGRFSDEEFFVALQAIILAGLWWWLWLAWYRVLTSPPGPLSAAERGSRAQRGGGEVRSSAKFNPDFWNPVIRIPRRRVWLPLAALVLALATALTWQVYLRSFFPDQAPSYAGVTPDAPFLCGSVAASPQSYDGRAVFKRMLDLVAAHPQKGAPEYGMLALGTGELTWAQQFRTQILAEADAGMFSGPANSVKYIQYEASGRVYYYDRVRAAFPRLFSAAEDGRVRAWFAAINRRALTVEWVDWTYSLALGDWPEGPYANQESGAGLLALLNATGLADPSLVAQNQRYLKRHPGGWDVRFRNTDDAIIYQPEWINNAYYQHLAGGGATPDQVRRSVEWLLVQALPDGAPLQYNYPLAESSAGAAYLAANILGDPRYIWLAGRALAGQAASLGYTGAQPGIEQPLNLVGQAPTTGSCLVFGGSGMPNQPGPLAPDKIIFRDGWEAGSLYAMLNLRFSGWHRYKASNTLTLAYQSGPLIADQLEGPTFGWLPLGRRFFRDKRIPRENLSGLLVARSGMSDLVGQLTGDSPWAQDPPFYANVESFQSGAEYDHSSTSLSNWRGWSQQRTVWMYHGGPLVVYDRASGPAGQPAVISWNLPNAGPLQARRIALRGGSSPAELVFAGAGALQEDAEGGAARRILALPDQPGQLSLVSVLLTQGWVGADVQFDAATRRIVISHATQRIVISLDR